MAKKKNLVVAATKADFVKAIKAELGEMIDLTNDQAKAVYEVFVKIVKDTLAAEEKMALNGLGTFKIRKVAARDGINPRTKEKIKIKASKTVGFKPAPSFKKEL